MATGLTSHLSGSVAPAQQQPHAQHMPPPGAPAAYAYPPYPYPAGMMVGYPGYSAPPGMRQGYYGQEAQYAAVNAYGQPAYYRAAYPYPGYYVAPPYGMHPAAVHPGVMQVCRCLQPSLCQLFIVLVRTVPGALSYCISLS